MSGKFSNHNTVVTIFQVMLEQPSKKPNKTQIDLTKATTKGKTPWQEKEPFLNKKKNIKLSSIFKKKSIYNRKKAQDLENLHFFVNAIRNMFLDEVECLLTYAACRSLVSEAQAPCILDSFRIFNTLSQSHFTSLC